MPGCLRAIIGLVLLPVVHLPRFIYLALLLSYAAVFSKRSTLTASPREHLKRARKRLKGGNANLLYAAIEVRFALERMTQWELIMASKATTRSLQEYEPVKKVRALRRLDARTAKPHAIYLVNRTTGERFEWGRYKPLDETRVKEMQGRLGDLLHPKEGLNLGIPDDPWYLATRRFLEDAITYLEDAQSQNTAFFAFEGLAHIEMVEADG